MKKNLNIKDIYDRYYKNSYLFVRSYVYDEEVANDIVSESLIKLWYELKEKDGQEHNIKAFLFSILKNMSLDYLRHQAVKQQALNKLSSIQQREVEIRISSLEESEYNEILIREIQDIVNETMSKMKDKTREVFKLSRFEYLTNKEIAAKLDITEKGVEYHMNIALKMLRTDLKDYMHFFFSLSFFF